MVYKIIKAFIEKRLFLVVFIASLLYTFPVYNKYWAPFDEGIVVVAAQSLLAGEIPYKDFFLIMYPPGQVWVLALLFKIFSYSITPGRIYAVFMSVGISMLVFTLVLRLTRNRIVSLISWFIALVSLAPRLGAIPAPIWPGMFLALGALYAYGRHLESSKRFYMVLAGALTAFCVLFRHDIGIFVLIALFGSLFVRFLFNKKSFGDMMQLLATVFIILLPVSVYFVQKGAAKDMINSLFLFPLVHEKTAGIVFPAPCLDLRMIFHGSLHFIKVNQYYIPILVYLYTSIYLLGQFFKKEIGKKENLILISILLFGIFTFNQARIRTDPAHLLTVIAPAVILFGVMAHKTVSRKLNLMPGILFKYAIAALIFMLFALLTVKNIDKYIKNTYRKAYKGDIVRVNFERGAVYVPREEKEEVFNTLNFIRENTLPKERIYIGNIAHWKDDFGGSLVLYFLAGRLPSTKYYELVPGLVTDSRVQEEIKNSLLKYNVNLLVLQDIDLGSLREEDAPKDKRALDDFIKSRYKPVKKFGKYNIYLKK